MNTWNVFIPGTMFEEQVSADYCRIENGILVFYDITKPYSAIGVADIFQDPDIIVRAIKTWNSLYLAGNETSE